MRNRPQIHGRSLHFRSSVAEETTVAWGVVENLFARNRQAPFGSASPMRSPVLMHTPQVASWRGHG